MMTLMGIAARNMNVDIKRHQKLTVQKEMVATPLRHIGKLNVQIKVPGKFTDEQKKKLETAALTCPYTKACIQISRFQWNLFGRKVFALQAQICALRVSVVN